MELDLRAIVSHLMWVLGIKLRSSTSGPLTTEPSIQTPKRFVRVCLFVCWLGEGHISAMPELRKLRQNENYYEFEVNLGDRVRL